MPVQRDNPASALALAWVGSILIAIGTLAPFASANVIGEVNLYWHSNAGIIVLLLAVGSVVLASVQWYNGLFATGAVAFAITVYEMSSVQQLAQSILQYVVNISLGWAWLPLMLGSILIFSSPIAYRKSV